MRVQNWPANHKNQLPQATSATFLISIHRVLLKYKRAASKFNDLECNSLFCFVGQKNLIDQVSSLSWWQNKSALNKSVF